MANGPQVNKYSSIGAVNQTQNTGRLNVNEMGSSPRFNEEEVNINLNRITTVSNLNKCPRLLVK